MIEKIPQGYEDLYAVLCDAFKQAAYGKGNERHGQGRPFASQHMQSISDLLNDENGMAYQAIKKVAEALDLPTAEARRKELLGAIIYIAGMVVWFDRRASNAPRLEEPLTGDSIGSIGPHADRYAGVGGSPIGKYAGYAPAMPSTLHCCVCEAWPCQCRVMANSEGPHDPYSHR